MPLLKAHKNNNSFKFLQLRSVEVIVEIKKKIVFLLGIWKRLLLTIILKHFAALEYFTVKLPPPPYYFCVRTFQGKNNWKTAGGFKNPYSIRENFNLI